MEQPSHEVWELQEKQRQLEDRIAFIEARLGILRRDYTDHVQEDIDGQPRSISAEV